jgi:hypothetical protein
MTDPRNSTPDPAAENDPTVRLDFVRDFRPHPNTAKGYPKRIAAQFGDGKWYALAEIAAYLEAPMDEVERSLATMVKDGRGGTVTEKRKVGLVKEFKILRNARLVNSAELTAKLTPIVKRLKEQGRKSQATISGPAILILANDLEKVLAGWTEGPLDVPERASSGSRSHRSKDVSHVAKGKEQSASADDIALTAAVRAGDTRVQGSDPRGARQVSRDPQVADGENPGGGTTQVSPGQGDRRSPDPVPVGDRRDRGDR